MKSADVVKLLNLHDSTLRRYSQEYAEFLSPAGAGGAGHHREYSERDVQVLRYILDMKTQRIKPDDIAATLSSLRASNWERLPALDQATQSIVPTPGALIAAGARESAMQREIDVLREMLDSAEKRAEAKSADRDQLLERLHRAETLLELYRSGELSPKRPE